MLAWFSVKGGPKRISDERASSGSEIDTSEHAGEMRRARLRAVLVGDYAAIPRPKEKAEQGRGDVFGDAPCGAPTRSFATENPTYDFCRYVIIPLRQI